MYDLCRTLHYVMWNYESRPEGCTVPRAAANRSIIIRSRAGWDQAKTGRVWFATLLCASDFLPACIYPQIIIMNVRLFVCQGHKHPHFCSLRREVRAEIFRDQGFFFGTWACWCLSGHVINKEPMRWREFRFTPKFSGSNAAVDRGSQWDGAQRWQKMRSAAALQTDLCEASRTRRRDMIWSSIDSGIGCRCTIGRTPIRKAMSKMMFMPNT